MNLDETSSLLGSSKRATNGLSTLFAVVCILDVFGVFPVITLPKAILDCGFYGVFIVLLVCSLQIYTSKLLGICWILAEEMFPTIHRKSRYPYAALAEVTYGRRLSMWVTVLLDLTIFGGGIPNLIVASYNLQLLSEKISSNTLDVSYCYWIIVLGVILCPILWMGSPKDMKWLCSFSVIIVIAVFLLTFSCILSATSEEIIPNNTPTNEFPWKSMLKAYGIIAFQFDIHPTILTIQVDMKDKTKLPKAVTLGFVISLTMFALTTIAAYLKYGNSIQASFLDTLPSTMPLHFAAVLVAVQLCLTSAISNSALYQQMEECMSISRSFNPKRCILRTTLTVFSIVIAESVPKFDLVMSLIGGTLTAPIVFILPPIIYLKISSMYVGYKETLAMESFYQSDDDNDTTTRYMEQRSGDFSSILAKYDKTPRQLLVDKIICSSIVICSIVVTLSTTYINFSDVVYSYSNLTRPCIYNVTAALVYL